MALGPGCSGRWIKMCSQDHLSRRQKLSQIPEHSSEGHAQAVGQHVNHFQAWLLLGVLDIRDKRFPYAYAVGQFTLQHVFLLAQLPQSRAKPSTNFCGHILSIAPRFIISLLL